MSGEILIALFMFVSMFAVGFVCGHYTGYTDRCRQEKEGK